MLAIDGGEKVRGTPFPRRGLFTEEEKGVVAALFDRAIETGAAVGRVVAHAIWFTERKVFGTSDYPWGLPDYGGNRKADFPCPNAVETMASHFVIRLYEAWGPQEAADAVAAIEKVEKAYLK